MFLFLPWPSSVGTALRPEVVSRTPWGWQELAPKAPALQLQSVLSQSQPAPPVPVAEGTPG